MPSGRSYWSICDRWQRQRLRRSVCREGTKPRGWPSGGSRSACERRQRRRRRACRTRLRSGSSLWLWRPMALGPYTALSHDNKASGTKLPALSRGVAWHIDLSKNIVGVIMRMHFHLHFNFHCTHTHTHTRVLHSSFRANPTERLIETSLQLNRCGNLRCPLSSAAPPSCLGSEVRWNRPAVCR